ncbi:unnamed protein product [Vicia faba]|uniref:Uncharacterized protein n=1 Tax=Vicia faba TaxID=3906 RepID=A0AAV1ARP9_VICFA|nr:unnamed protein product [Vicia faba]
MIIPRLSEHREQLQIDLVEAANMTKSNCIFRAGWVKDHDVELNFAVVDDIESATQDDMKVPPHADTKVPALVDTKVSNQDDTKLSIQADTDEGFSEESGDLTWINKYVNHGVFRLWRENV